MWITGSLFCFGRLLWLHPMQKHVRVLWPSVTTKQNQDGIACMLRIARKILIRFRKRRRNQDYQKLKQTISVARPVTGSIINRIREATSDGEILQQIKEHRVTGWQRTRRGPFLELNNLYSIGDQIELQEDISERGAHHCTTKLTEINQNARRWVQGCWLRVRNTVSARHDLCNQG